MENSPNLLKNPAEYQEKVLELMKSYEDLIGDLYMVYAEKGVNDIGFWKKITEDERKHAYWIETLANSLGSGKIFFDEERFNIAPLEQVIRDAKANISYARNNSTDAVGALSVAHDIEMGMIEKKFFEVFESDSAEIKETFSMLKKETMQHSALVENMLEKERQKSNAYRGGFFQRIKSFFGMG